MYFILFLQQLIASSTHVVSKSLTDTLSPSLLLLLRALIASSIFLVWIIYKRKKLPEMTKRDFLKFIVLGFLCIPLNQYLFFIAIKNTTAANVSLAYALCPAFVLILERIYLKTKSTKLRIIGMAAAFIGASLIFLERGVDLSSAYFVGNMIALTASFSWALYTVMGKKMINHYGAIYSTGLAIIFGFILFLPIFFISGTEIQISSIPTIDWVKILYLGSFTSVIGYVLWYWVLKKIDASKLSVFNNLQPVMTTILAAIFLTQEFTPLFIIGGTITIGGVILAQRG